MKVVSTASGQRTQHLGSQPPVRAVTPAPTASRPVTPAPPSVTASAAVAQPPQNFAPGDLVPGTVVGEYKVEKKLGEGGMGAVYAAVHPLIGKKAAIKVISAALCTDEAQVERFVQEARSVNQIGHPNIVDVFAFGTLPDGRSYFVMEWLQGASLADRVAKGNMPFAEAIEILDQAADALEAAHEKGIVHRDLKPDNVFLVAVRGNRQLVKLLDFGIAKLAAGDMRMQKTATGMMMGTPGYISPEQARGKSDVDHRTDLYAYGCMAYEMFLGRLPFVAESAMDVVLKHLTEAPPPPRELWPDIPPSLEAILSGLLDKEPSRRPTLPQVRAVLQELRGMALATMTPEAAQGFRSGFGPRPVTPGQPQRFMTPVPGSVPGMTGSIAAVQPSAMSTTTASGAATEMIAAATQPARSKKGLFIGLGALVLGGGAAAALALGGGGKPAAAPAAAAAAAPAPAKDPEPPPPPPAKDPVTTPPTTPEVAKGKLVVNVDAPDATIELDGKKIASSTNFVAIDVPEGDHKLVVSAPGRKPSERTVTIAGGVEAKADVKLEPEKAARKPGSGDKKPAGGGDKKPAGEGDKKPGGGGGEDYTLDPFAKKKPQ